MRTMPAALTNYLAALTGDAKVWRADLITLTLLDGSTHFHWTTSDDDIVYGGNTYLAGGGGSAPTIRRGPCRFSLAPTIDTLDLDVGGPFTIGGKTLGALALAGYFDGASIVVDHLMGAYPGDTSLGAILSWFNGSVAEVNPSAASVAMRCKSALAALNVIVPKFPLQRQCGNAIYDTHCGLIRSAYSVVGEVNSATTTQIVARRVYGVSALPFYPDNYFNLGVLTFTSGTLNGTTHSVKNWDQAQVTLTLSAAASVAASIGDIFSVAPGCDRSYNTCLYRYANLNNFRGFPRIPRDEAGQ